MSGLFGSNSEDYKKYRPLYPKELIEFLAGVCTENELAWDCGCGTGQVSITLSNYFRQVVGTDISSGQTKNAEKADNIIYRVSAEDHSGLEHNSADLVTCAQALHWFDLNKFYKEVTRVLKPGGIIAVWTYNLFRVNKEIDELIDRFYFGNIYNYWPEERKQVENGYSDLEFPYTRIAVPEFSMETEWDIDQLIGYLNTWTGVQNYIEIECFSPLEFIEKDLADLWGEENLKKKIKWPLTVLAGRV
ncbi:MAG: class I SAM-dependent methyltransferase [Candidatus Dadabacteria bacterium]|nr:class I SAM-dependent methyltransferase [Candidatus Dadabacteria bacterium]NIS09029.1 class I SAM-dependent methyltransferase [Candidatus Dadabacteria bacterium]NIX15623.1 methyltransferase domain-containing protein [Candidatus Dadabacteria bacterium]NIY22365.1 methyltransferase domain-containing protein [Candidatus Dadabacteria bacterium]